MSTAVILASLERASERTPDPAPLVYQRLFELKPEFEALFVMDMDGGVRRQMLQTCFNIITGLLEDSQTPHFLIGAGRLHHDGYGVPGAEFDLMFHAIRDTIRGLDTAHWTAAEEAAWAELLKTIATIE
jgi:hemoglobin-like flavoprotein